MTAREKLIEMLDHATRAYRLNAWENTDKIADFFLANGVTFAKDTDVPSKWISVEDRLPEKEDYYLCCVKSFCRPGRFYINILDYYKDGFKEGHIYTDSVTHWMPLPQLPREE